VPLATRGEREDRKTGKPENQSRNLLRPRFLVWLEMNLIQGCEDQKPRRHGRGF